MRKRVLITGINGQVGSYMAEYLLEKDYDVYGLVRRQSNEKFDNIQHILNKITLIHGDLTDQSSLLEALAIAKPDECYNFAAQSLVPASWEQPELTANITAVGVLRLLEAIRKYNPNIKILQASSSVSGNTPILIKKDGEIQLVHIETLCNNKDGKTYYDNLKCLTIDDNYNVKFSKVAYIFSHKKNNLYRLKGSYGLEIDITGDHSVVILGEDGKLKEKKVEELKKEDFLVTFCSNDINKKYYPELPLCKIRPKYETRSIMNRKTLKLNNELMRLFGYYLAEGNTGNSLLRKAAYITTFSFHIKEKHYVDDIECILKKYNIKAHHSTQPKSHARKVYFHCRQLNELILQSFSTGSKNKFLPNWIWNIPKDGIIEFFRGYLGDAKISKNEVAYTSVNKSLIINLCYLAKINGLDGCIVYRKYNPGYYHLSPQGKKIHSSQAFDLKFFGRFSDKILGKSINRNKNRQVNADLIPAKIINKLEKGNIAYLTGRKNSISKRRLKEHSLCSIVEKLVNSDLGIIRIKSINRIQGNHLVYDLHVPETQRFIGGNYPMLLHNSEMFGSVIETPQSEMVKFNPVSPYACSKVFAHYIMRTYRFSYNMFAANAISFNHESLRRGQEFVTRKISMGVAKIKIGLANKIILGNLDSKRDWSHAKDIVRGIYLIMQHSEPDDFVLCSGENHSIREFLAEAFAIIGVSDWQQYVEVDQQFMRPADVNFLLGDCTKAKTILNWKPEISFKELVREMVENDIRLLQRTA